MIPRPAVGASRENLVLPVCNFLSKGWEVGLLGLLAFIQVKYSLPLYQVGILSTVFVVSQIVVSLFAGKLAHALDSGNVILLALGASALSWLSMGLTARVPVLYLVYLLGGIASGLFEPIGNSLIAQRSSSNARGRAIGNFAAFGDMGRIAVVAAATALAGWFGLSVTAFILLASCLAALLLAFVFLEKPAPAGIGEKGEPPIQLYDLLKNRRFCYATAAGITDSFSSASLYIFIPFLLAAKGVALSNTLYFNAIFFAGYMSGRLVLGRLADRFGGARVLIAADIAMAVLILLLTTTTGRPEIVGLLFLLGMFTRGTSPIIRAMVADSVDETNRFHEAFSAYSFASRSSSAVCRPIYGYLAFYSGIASVFYVASAVALATVYPALRYQASKEFTES